MSLARELTLELSEGGADESPLGLLGLTEQVLSLGLTDEELYRVTRRFARNLLSEVHEDRAGKSPRIEALERRFSRAMSLLRTEATFQRHLSALRASLSQKRREEASRESVIRGLREQIDNLTRSTGRAVDAIRLKYDTDRKAQDVRYSLLNGQVLQLRRRAVRAEDRALTARADVRRSLARTIKGHKKRVRESWELLDKKRERLKSLKREIDQKQKVAITLREAKECLREAKRVLVRARYISRYATQDQLDLSRTTREGE